MSISLQAASAKYLTAKKLSGGTRKEYKSTITKWITWGKGVDVDQINRSHIRDFLDWLSALDFLAEVTQHKPTIDRSAFEAQQSTADGASPGGISTWATLIKHVYEVDPLECPCCGGQMQIVSFINRCQGDVIDIDR
jgi:hypothetical protein